MSYFRLAISFLSKRWLFTLIIIIEIAALLVLTNVMIATVHSKQMIYEPYKKILSENGVMLDVSNLDIMECENEDIKPFLETWPDKKSVKGYLEKRLSVKIYCNDSLSFWNMTGPRSVMYKDRGNTLSYYLLDGDILSEMSFPLSCGRWPSVERNSDGEIEIVVSGGTDAQLGSVYDTPAGKMRVVGILTDSTYKPIGSDVDRTGMEPGIDRDSIFNYCLPFDINTNLGGPFAVASKSAFGEEKDGYNIIPHSLWFVSYGDLSDDEAIASVTAYLNTVGSVQYGQTLGTIAEETERQINDIYYRMMPIIITAAIMVLSGMIGSTAIMMLRQIKSFGIFLLCGCRKRDCLYIASLETGIIISIAAIAAYAGLFIMKKLGYDYLIGLSFGADNIILSAIMILMLFVLSMIMPLGMIRSVSPFSIIKEN